MRTLFEAYLTEKEDKYLLYLDEFHFSELFKSIGFDNIQKIRVIYQHLEVDKGITDEIIYAGIGEVPDMFDILRMTYSRDLFEKIIINENIEISFLWWDDVFILADWETIIKCIEGQKTLATKSQHEILDRLTDSQNTYFKLKNETLIVSQQMDFESLMVLLHNSYTEKEEELLCDLTDEERAEYSNFEEEHIKLNLSKEERARLKSGLDIFTFMQAETVDTEETVICPCRVVLDKAKRDTKYDDETVVHCIEFPDLIEFGSNYYYETNLLNDEFVKLNKNELIRIKEFFDKFNFPETPEGNIDENEFFDELSELYLSPSEDESHELISKYHKYYIPITQTR